MSNERHHNPLADFARDPLLDARARFPDKVLPFEKVAVGDFEAAVSPREFAGREGVLTMGDFALGRVRMNDRGDAVEVMEGGLVPPDPQLDRIYVTVRVELGRALVPPDDAANLVDDTIIVFEEGVDDPGYLYIEDQLLARVDVAFRYDMFGVILSEEYSVTPENPRDPLSERAALQREIDRQKEQAGVVCRMILGEARFRLDEIARWNERTFIPLPTQVGTPMRLEFSDGRVREGEIGGGFGADRRRYARVLTPAPYPDVKTWMPTEDQPMDESPAEDPADDQRWREIAQTDPKILYSLLTKESPAAAAMVLGRIEPSATARVLEICDAASRANLLKRIASARETTPTTRAIVSTTILQSLREAANEV